MDCGTRLVGDESAKMTVPKVAVAMIMHEFRFQLHQQFADVVNTTGRYYHISDSQSIYQQHYQ